MNLEFLNEDKGQWSLNAEPFNLINMEIHIKEDGMFQVHITNATIREQYKKANRDLAFETFSEAKEVADMIYKDVIKREYETYFSTLTK